MLRRVLVLPLFVIACTPEPIEGSAKSQREPKVEAPPVTSPATQPARVESTEPAVGPEPTEPTLEPPLGEAPLEPAAPLEPEPPKDELAPELPKGPEPGSAESDAELLALLDESTLTQDEFAKAFAGGKDPKLGEDDQFEFGAGERSRQRSKVGIGAASVSAGKVAAADVEALARGDLHELEVCHAMALSKNAQELGRATLTLELDGQGAVKSVTVESKLSSALEDCLGSVAKDWKLDGGSKATVKLPLTLSTQ